MKKNCLALIFWLLHVACFGQACVRPLVATEFGKPIVVTAEFVVKSNTYYAQNLVPEPFTLNVIAVDGQRLKQAVLIEYKLEAGKKEKKEVEHAGVTLEFEAYETLYQPISANPWLAEWEQGQAFTLVHVLHIRPANQRQTSVQTERRQRPRCQGAAVPHPYA